MPSESCSPQLFLGLPSYDSTFNLLEVHGLFFLFSSFEHDICIPKDIFSPFSFTASSHLNMSCNPSTNWNLAFVVAVHLECFNLVIQVPWCFPVIPVLSWKSFQLFSYFMLLLHRFLHRFFFKIYGLDFCGLFLFCRAAEELPFLCIWRPAASLTQVFNSLFTTSQ